MIKEKESWPGHFPGQSGQMDQKHSENPNKHSFRNANEKDSVRGRTGKRQRVRSPWYVSPLTRSSVNVDNWTLNRAHWRGRKLGPLTNAFAILLCLLLCPLMWQACQNLTFTVVLRGRRGTPGTGRLGLGSGERDARDAAPLLRGMRGTKSPPPSCHVAGVPQPHTYRRFLCGRRGTYT